MGTGVSHARLDREHSEAGRCCGRWRNRVSVAKSYDAGNAEARPRRSARLALCRAPCGDDRSRRASRRLPSDAARRRPLCRGSRVLRCLGWRRQPRPEFTRSTAMPSPTSSPTSATVQVRAAGHNGDRRGTHRAPRVTPRYPPPARSGLGVPSRSERAPFSRASTPERASDTCRAGARSSRHSYLRDWTESLTTPICPTVRDR